MKKPKLEVCIDSVESAIAAQNGGADRIEMCANIVLGGTTPSPMLFKEIKKYINIPVRALIRPRFGDFLYNKYEFDIILAEIAMYRDLGADAIVVGCLKEDGTINMEQMQQVVETAKGMDITFHRAFDVCRNPLKALEQIVDLKIGTILTSGQKNNFVEGQELLTKLLDYADGRVEIMAGGGVTPQNLQSISHAIRLDAYHMSGKITAESKMQYRNPEVNMGIATLSEFEIIKTSEDNIRQVKTLINKLN